MEFESYTKAVQNHDKVRITVSAEAKDTSLATEAGLQAILLSNRSWSHYSARSGLHALICFNYLLGSGGRYGPSADGRDSRIAKNARLEFNEHVIIWVINV